MRLPTVKQYQDAIANALSERQIETLKTLYYFPDSSATAKELATALNYASYHAANRQVGQIGKTIARHLDIQLPTYEDRGFRPAYYSLVGEYYSDNGWNMWAQLQKALENLKHVSSTDEEEIPERLPTELPSFDENKLFKEGKLVQVFVNRYERNWKAKNECIKFHGDSCAACGFNFLKTYGTLAEGFIHVHHITPLKDIKEEYKVNPVTDLIPLCPNCHSVVHLAKPELTLEQIKKLVKKKGR